MGQRVWNHKAMMLWRTSRLACSSGGLQKVFGIQDTSDSLSRKRKETLHSDRERTGRLLPPALLVAIIGRVIQINDGEARSRYCPSFRDAIGCQTI